MSTTTPPPESPKPVLSYAPTPLAKYTVGTLAYTTPALIILFSWLIWGDFAWSMKERCVEPVVKLLLRKFEATDTLAGILFSFLPPLLGLVLSPIISVKSDRCRSRWGRRIPFLLLSTPIAAAAMIALAYSPALAKLLTTPGTHLHNLYTLALITAFWTIFELATTVANAVFGAFINDVVPRQFIGRFYGLFRALSLIAGILFNYYLFGKAEYHYQLIFVAIGLLYGLGFTAMCLKVKEGHYEPPPPAHPTLSPLTSIQTYLKDCFGNPYYLWVFAAVALPVASLAPINLFNLYFAKSQGLTTDDYGKYLALTFAFSLAQAYPLGYLADRFHPLRVAISALILHLIAALLGGLLIHNKPTFALYFVLCGVLAGTWYTATASLGATLLPRAKFAQYASAMGIVTSVVSMLIGPLMGYLLDLLNHPYRLVYLSAAAFDLAGLLVTIILYQKFLRLGGQSHYTPPES